MTPTLLNHSSSFSQPYLDASGPGRDELLLRRRRRPGHPQHLDLLHLAADHHLGELRLRELRLLDDGL